MHPAQLVSIGVSGSVADKTSRVEKCFITIIRKLGETSTLQSNINTVSAQGATKAVERVRHKLTISVIS
jgi:hypothetical protein